MNQLPSRVNDKLIAEKKEWNGNASHVGRDYYLRVMEAGAVRLGQLGAPVNARIAVKYAEGCWARLLNTRLVSGAGVQH